MHGNILFIGPFASGKTSVSEELSIISNLPLFPVDKWKWYFLYRNGYSVLKARKIMKEEGVLEAENFFRKCFEINEMVNIMEQFSNAIIEIPPINTYYFTHYEIKKMNYLIEQSKYTFLLLPCKNQKRAIQELNKRIDNRFNETKQDFPELLENYKGINKWIIKHKTNKHKKVKTIYTENLSSKEVAEGILNAYIDILKCE